MGRESGSSGFEASIDRQLLQLVALIDTKYLSGHGSLHPFDLSTKAQFFALDVISDVSFGSAFGFLTQDRDLYQYIEINDSAVPVMNMLQAVPWLTNIVYRWPLRLALPSDGDRVGFGRLMGWVFSVPSSVPAPAEVTLVGNNLLAWPRDTSKSGCVRGQNGDRICCKHSSMAA